MIKLNTILISGIKQPYKVLVGYAVKESPLQQRNRNDKPNDKPKDKPKEDEKHDWNGKSANKKELVEKLKRLRGADNRGTAKKQS